ncbi:taurine ABC transporter substrate-binding protein [Aliamphritea spongicola]|uniref:taurine ABC transporter substrate-binding protein n=1 Tax=Aliamphritea spongicola TaxID=707589 RepID=UPI00196AA8C8|nr:ABC transporter substrate-binding protein [Aliamphritea spongicola]MBN3563698.1 ABC transporter substrate-binding protein [Aliamphritea spongicola]
MQHQKTKTVLKHTLLGAALTAALSTTAQAREEITVAYFLEWPTPNLYAQSTQAYEDAMGVKINWVAFDSGTAMSAAMASGDVQISFSQGIPPFVVAASAGQDLQIIDVAVAYSENDNCVVREDLEIDKTNAKELAGKEVGVPIGTAAHYGFLKQMEHFGVDTGGMKIVDMAPPDAAAAFANGNLDMVCGWGGALKRMKEHGNVLLTGAEKEAIGIKVFDATVIPASFGDEHPELVAKFLDVTADMNSRYKQEPAAMLPTIAKAAGMDDASASSTLAGFSFPARDQQLSQAWLGGDLQVFLKEVADFFTKQGTIPQARASYDDAVDASYLQASSQL